MATRPPIPEPMERGARLDSWKAIAAYFQRDIRTVQRWERTEGLPVHRHSHEKAGTVHAYEDELERWWKQRSRQSEPESPQQARRTQPWKIAAILAGAAALAIGLGWEFARPRALSDAYAAVAAPIPGRLLANATSEGRAIRWIAVGKMPGAATASPDRKKIYVSNQLSGSVSVIDTATDQVVDEISVGGEPESMAIARDALYVANRGGYLSVIATSRKNAPRSIRTRGPVSALALAPDGTHLYLATGFSGLQELSLPDGRDRIVSNAAAAMYLALLPNPGRLYINYQAGGPGGRAGHDTIDMLDLTSGQIATVMSGPPNVGGEISVSPDGAQIWANGEDACWNPSYDRSGCPVAPGAVVNVIRSSDNRILRTLGFGNSVIRNISFFPDGSRAVLTGGETLRVVDTVRFATVEESNLPGSGKLAFAGTQAFCPFQDRNAVAVFDLRANHCVPPPAGLGAWWTGDGSGDDARALSGGSIQQRVAFAPGLVGQAFHLDSASRGLLLKPPSWGSSMEEMTIAAWMKMRGSAGAGEIPALEFFDELPGARSPGWRVVREGEGKLRLCPAQREQSGCGARGASGKTPLSPDAWTHVSISRGARQVVLYVNGAIEARISDVGLPHADDGTLRIGPGGRGFEWLVDEVQWFTRSLSAAELQSIVAAGARGVCYGGPTSSSSPDPPDPPNPKSTN